jgi:hypothetical protein
VALFVRGDGTHMETAHVAHACFSEGSMDSSLVHGQWTHGDGVMLPSAVRPFPSPLRARLPLPLPWFCFVFLRGRNSTTWCVVRVRRGGFACGLTCSSAPQQLCCHVGVLARLAVVFLCQNQGHGPISAGPWPLAHRSHHLRRGLLQPAEASSSSPALDPPQPHTRLRSGIGKERYI